MTALILALLLSDPISFELTRGGGPTSNTAVESADNGALDASALPVAPSPPAESLDVTPSEPGAGAAATPSPAPVSLRDRIAAYRNDGGGTVGVKNMTITTHMLRDHGWINEQLRGLTSDELYYLHGMQHAGKISPSDYGGEDVAEHSHEHEGDGYEIHIEGNKAYWYDSTGQYWDNSPGVAGSRMPSEGLTYNNGNGRKFVVRNGRIYESGSAPASTTRRTVVPQPVITWPAQNCPNGQCRRR